MVLYDMGVASWEWPLAECSTDDPYPAERAPVYIRKMSTQRRCAWMRLHGLNLRRVVRAISKHRSCFFAFLHFFCTFFFRATFQLVTFPRLFTYYYM